MKCTMAMACSKNPQPPRKKSRDPIGKPHYIMRPRGNRNHTSVPCRRASTQALQELAQQFRCLFRLLPGSIMAGLGNHTKLAAWNKPAHRFRFFHASKVVLIAGENERR